MSFIDWQERWEGNVDFYQAMKERGRVPEEDLCPDIKSVKGVMAAFRHLDSERTFSAIPVSKVHEYLTRHRLPDYWEPIIMKVDSRMTSKDAEKAEQQEQQEQSEQRKGAGEHG